MVIIKVLNEQVRNCSQRKVQDEKKSENEALEYPTHLALGKKKTF